MKPILLAIISAFLAAGCVTSDTDSASAGWDRLNQRKGAEAAVEVTVVDVDGHPLEGIPVKGYFYLYTQAKVNHDLKMTDADGKATVAGMCSSYDLIVELKKEGYYESSVNVDMLGRDYPGDGIVGVKKDKWYPRPAKRTLVFKEIRDPVPMVLFMINWIDIPETGKAFGYDLEYGSLVEPYGDGKVADFYLTSSWENTDEKSVTSITVTFPNEKDGFYLFPMCYTSELRSPYRADPDAQYTRELKLETTMHKNNKGQYLDWINGKKIPGSQGLILRTRSVVDAEGRLVSAHYSKIYGELVAGGKSPNQLRFMGDGGVLHTYFNPAPNSTSLEIDGKHHRELRKGKRRPDDQAYQER